MPDSVVCPAPLANRGDVRTGPPLTHTFRMENRGSQTMNLRLAEASCGCLRRELSRANLGPGELAELTVTVNTLTAAPGPNSWEVTGFAERDGVSQRFAVTLKANLIREITVTPPAVAISTTGTASQTITISDSRVTPLTVMAAQTSAAFVQTRIGSTRTTENVRHHDIDVSVTADAPVGVHEAVLVLITNDPQCRELRVPIRVTKRQASAVIATPESVVLRFAPGQELLSGLVQLRAGGTKLAIGRMESNHPAVSVKGGAAGLSATLRITVDRAKINELGGRAEVRIEFTEPVGQTVIVPVEWSAQ